jgi:NitT/TauT family transport system substrate-binding protein
MLSQTRLDQSYSRFARWLGKAAGVGLILAGQAFGLTLSLATACQAEEAPLKKVKIGIGTLALNATYPWVMMPPVLGYWKEEGLDVQVFAANNSLQAIQLMAAGNVDIIEVNTGPLLQAAADNNVAIRAIMVNTVIDWSLIALESGPLKTIADFKGKTVGVSSLGTGGVALLKSHVAANGLNPETDITFVAVGVGPSALESLRSGRVDGLMYWGSAINSFEVTGVKFRYFFDPQWRKYPDFSLTTMQSTIQKDPKMVEGIIRGAAKASLFAMTNPDCVRRLHWARYPDTKPTGTDEAKLIKDELARLKGQQDGMQQALDVGGGKLWGNVAPRDFAQLQDFFLDTKVIKRKLADPSKYMIDTPGFFEQVNSFDHEAIVKQANECRAPAEGK